MSVFLSLGVAGVALLALALIFDGIFEGLFHGVLGGLFEGLLSLPVLAGFTAMLGFTGVIVLETTDLGAGPAAAVGAVPGAVAGWFAWRLSRALMRSETTRTPRSTDLVGTSGSVVTAIPVGGYGEVLLRVGGQPVKFSARSAVPLARGAEIWVEESLSSTAVGVRPIER